MFGRKHKGPSLPPFSHSDGCRILQADPSVEIPWSEVESGHWVATCQCGEQHYREPREPARRLDPLDPTTASHLPQCELANEDDRAVLKVALRIKPGLGEGYDWVECNACGGGWQVPHYAAESVG
jgi:hypothetical protein